MDLKLFSGKTPNCNAVKAASSLKNNCGIKTCIPLSNGSIYISPLTLLPLGNRTWSIKRVPEGCNLGILNAPLRVAPIVLPEALRRCMIMSFLLPRKS